MLTPAERKLYKPYKGSLDVRAAWKSYPVRIPGPGLSRCHRKPVLLAQSSDGTFVQGVCTSPACGKLSTLSATAFRDLRLWVACPACRRCMVPEMPASGYGYSCTPCKLYISLADLLPITEDVVTFLSTQPH